jgi:hypothetical protein
MSDDEAIEWVTLNLPARVIVGEAEAPCQIVTLSIVGLVILPAMKGQAGMQFEIEFQPSHWPTPVLIPAVLAREGAFHGNYAWQVQYGDPIPPETSAAILELLGYEVPPLQQTPAENELIAEGDSIEGEFVEEAKDPNLRSYSDLLAQMPDVEVAGDVAAANVADDGEMYKDPEERDLWEEVDNIKLKKIYKAAVKQVAGRDKPAKKKGWFSK